MSKKLLNFNVNVNIVKDILFSKYIQVNKWSGPSTDPLETALLTKLQFETAFTRPTLCSLPIRKSFIHSSKRPLIPKASSFIRNFECETLSNAFEKSVKRLYAVKFYTETLVIEDFNASNSLLKKFKARHNIKNYKMCGDVFFWF